VRSFHVERAERKVARCKVALQVAYDELRAERAKLSKTSGTAAKRKLATAYAPLEKFCDEYLARNADEHGIGKLPIRYRFVMCALAAGMARPDIAKSLPKVNGKNQFVRNGISVSGLSGVIRKAQYALQRVNAPPPEPVQPRDDIDVLELSVRAATACERLGIRSIAALAGRTPMDLLREPHVSVKTVRELQAELRARGLTLSGSLEILGETT